jgi:hypothetical protein
MREYEFFGLDVVSEMYKLIQEGKNEIKNNLSENIEYDKEYVQSFFLSAKGYDVPEDQLVIGNYYYPMQVAVTYQNKRIEVILVIAPVQFKGKFGGRLKFLYDNCDVSIFFPIDIALPPDWERFIYNTKEQLDQTINNLTLKFSNSDWVIRAHGYDTTGAFRSISNIN